MVEAEQLNMKRNWSILGCGAVGVDLRIMGLGTPVRSGGSGHGQAILIRRWNKSGEAGGPQSSALKAGWFAVTGNNDGR